MFRLLFILVSFTCVVPVNGQWQQVTIMGDSSLSLAEEIMDIEFNNDSTAVAIGSYYVVWRSNDNGEIWQQMQNLSDTSYGYFGGLYHIDTSQFIISGSQTLYRSFNNFKSFETIHYNYPFIGVLGGLTRRKPHEFHVLSTSRNTYIKSQNFKTNTFKDVTTLDPSRPVEVMGSLEVFFANDSVGYLLSSGNSNHLFNNAIHRTLDGGKTWKAIIWGSAIMDIYFFSGSSGIGFDGSRMFYFKDYGNSWDIEGLPIAGWPPNRASLYHPLEVVNDSVWYVYTEKAIIRTTDSGSTWQHIKPPDCGSCKITELACPNDSTCFVGTSPTAIYKSDDVGKLVTGMEDINANRSNTEDQLVIFPNPTGNEVTIHIPQKSVTENTMLNITNVVGKTIYRHKVNKGNLRLNVSAWADGVYFVVVAGKGEPTLKGKFVKN